LINDGNLCFQLTDALIRRLKSKGYDLIVIDAIYSLLGALEENSNEDISLLGRELFRLAKHTGAGVMFVHHFSKGSQQGKRGIEKASGAGAFGRFVDCSISIDQNPTKDCFNFEVTARSFAQTPAFVAKRTNGVWEVIEGAKVEHASGNQAGSLTDMLRLLEGNEYTIAQWKNVCSENLSMKDRTFDNRKAKARKARLITETKSGKNTICKLADGVEFDEEKGVYVNKTVANLVESEK
jgi:hypothetical protein